MLECICVFAGANQPLPPRATFARTWAWACLWGHPCLHVHSPPFITPLQPNPLDPNSACVHILDEHVGRVIGKRGAHIKEIQDASQATVYLPKECLPGTNVREVVISGTPSAIARCRELLQAKMTPPNQALLPLPIVQPQWPGALGSFGLRGSPPVWPQPAYQALPTFVQNAQGYPVPGGAFLYPGQGPALGFPEPIQGSNSSFAPQGW